MTDPDQILANYEGTLAEAQRRSDAIRETLATLQVTERSADGQISVTVNDAGNLVDLRLGNALQRKDGDAVGRDVLRVVQAAQGRVAAAVQEAMAPLMGADSEAMHMMMDKLRSAQPPAEPERPSWGPQESGLGRIEDDAPRASRPPQPPRRPDDEDDDFGDGGYLR
ncbi:YbaB/EbfC family nucleoid-associated protein [Lentzea sp. NPDC051838]|uniref:YbaB/EbfC family nucleoid-associated protein n=1 Tax=Lentzea sp. NPDC051838 TaxID=3154849 RepID=UPI0034460598